MSFEVERFEWTAGDRLEVAGRWFDVRGRRFLRPTLDVKIDGRSRRLLATLEHKPWAADEGEEWLAAFAWDGEAADIEAAQLTVGPDLAVELAPPAAAAAVGLRRDKGDGRELAAARAEVKRQRAAAEREREALLAQADDLRERLAGAEEKARSHAVALHELEERASSAQAAAAERYEALARQRDAALAEREAAAAALEQAIRERDAARAQLRLLESELEAAVRARNDAREQRNSCCPARETRRWSVMPRWPPVMRRWLSAPQR
jgi:hypothetical protein